MVQCPGWKTISNKLRSRPFPQKTKGCDLILCPIVTLWKPKDVVYYVVPSAEQYFFFFSSRERAFLMVVLVEITCGLSYYSNATEGSVFELVITPNF